MREYKFILVNGEPVPEPDLLKWAAWAENEDNRRVALTKLPLCLTVSTVFLAIDHDFLEDGEPLLFETMVFWRSWHLGHPERYSTLEQAMAGHERGVTHAKKKIKRLRYAIRQALKRKGGTSSKPKSSEMDLLDLD